MYVVYAIDMFPCLIGPLGEKICRFHRWFTGSYLKYTFLGPPISTFSGFGNLHAHIPRVRVQRQLARQLVRPALACRFPGEPDYTLPRTDVRVHDALPPLGISLRRASRDPSASLPPSQQPLQRRIRAALRLPRLPTSSLLSCFAFSLLPFLEQG